MEEIMIYDHNSMLEDGRRSHVLGYVRSKSSFWSPTYNQ